MISKEEILKFLDYERETGLFRWKERRGGTAFKGSVAGTRDSKGYKQIRIMSRTYLAHRLVWAIENGKWPDTDLDHIDRNPLNNCITNLRQCTHAENHQNIGIRSHNTSGHTGVSWNKVGKKWFAYINLNNKMIRLGLFITKEEAIQARKEAKKRLHTFSQGAEI